MKKIALAKPVLILFFSTPMAMAATPTNMQAIVQVGTGGPEVLQLQTVPVPTPAADEVLIRAYAASVNPGDTKIRNGLLFPVEKQIIPGGDVAGVIEAVGPDVRSFMVGEPVWSALGPTLAESPHNLNGGYAEFVIARTARVMRKPKNMTYAQAAGVGVVGLTAVRYLEPLQLTSGKSVLITGVAGGVGSAAAQIAVAKGARVIGTARPAHNDYLRSIGVAQVIDYATGRFEDQIAGMDAVFDTRGGETAQRSLKTLKKGGAMVSVVGQMAQDKCAALEVKCLAPEDASEQRVGEFLAEVNRYATSGQLKINVDRVYPLEQAREAQRYSEQGHAEGKIILTMDAAKANSY
jgi:NADPH:quinone reductase-like Zn-dependent oxidoreductase